MNLRELLASQGLILLDGAMGTELARRGCVEGGSSNITSPDTVLAIHREYLKAGSQVLTTNTLTMNRIFIESHNVPVDVAEVNSTGARIAREAAGDGIPVLGDISSTGQILEPYGTGAEEAFYAAFLEQARILAENGVDGLIVETMFDLREAICAIKACKTVASLPVLATMTFSTEKNGGRTMMGNSAIDCARGLAEAGADAVGANCGEIGPDDMAEIVATMKSATHLPIIAQPNAGRPQLEGGVTRFSLSPHEFAKGIANCIAAGATIVGGCCGTSPMHIRDARELGRLARD